ncbi:LysR family transcriptional regulator [Acidaminobacter hydrogenoformans]|uniref:DNA-binding transcriptional regulator, LysR family n=1 Tax=Acidaminobacter hydrogenoformans DSM 2784 TaxID=1120920 RepID=A0A1G5S3Y3_9FIRM|nr:LysR family transcriptional regulator [Acidaminobacter hydrogenoformans]SCZ80249.1 DNA-binding transcriptional regulator, LysR family [Acidaminobacter hydrogenoformans DSM 2784]
MELRNVTTFLKVAESGSFTKAAEQLGYVQSTVTVQIQQLEKEIGFPLFDRIGKKVSLTPMGQEFIVYANQLERIAAESKQIGKNPKNYSGHLRIGVLESLFVWLIEDLLIEYHNEFPNVSVETKTASGSDLFNLLRQNQLDLIYLLDKKITEKDCVRTFAWPVKIVFVTSPEHPITKMKKIAFQDVLQYPLILTEKNGIYRKALEDFASERNTLITPYWEIDNTGTIVKLIKHGLGIAFLPEYTVNESVEGHELVALEVEDCSIEFWSQLFYNKNKWITPPMDGFIKMIESCYQT